MTTPALPPSAVALWRDGPTSIDGERWRTYRVDDYQEPYLAIPRADMERLLAALAFYADAVKYDDGKTCSGWSCCGYCERGRSTVARDDGETARRALAPEGGSDAK